MRSGPAHVYVISAQGHRAVKIGFAAKPLTRLRDLQTGCPFRLTLEWSFPTYGAPEVETALHRRFAAQRVQGEWFDLGPDGAIVAQQAYAEITRQPHREPPEPPFVSVMAEPAKLFLADIYPWAMATPEYAKHVTAEHLHQQLKATGIARWQEDRCLVTVGRILNHLFEDKFFTPTRQYTFGIVRTSLIRKAAQRQHESGDISKEPSHDRHLVWVPGPNPYAG